MARRWLGEFSILNTRGDAVAGADYRIETEAGVLATVYADKTGSPTVPASGDADRKGRAAGWVDPGRYVMKVWPDTTNEELFWFQCDDGSGGGGGGGGYSEVTTKGDLLAATGAGVMERVPLPALGSNRAMPVSDPGPAGGVKWMAKLAPYTPYEASAGVGQGNAGVDRAALQTCADAAAAAKSKMEIPPSSIPLFLDSTRWAIPANSYIYGYGKDKSTIKVNDGVTTNENVTNANITTGAPNITLDGIHFDANTRGRPGIFAGLLVFRNQLTTGVNPEGFTIRNCYINDCSSIAFLILNYNHVRILNNRVDGGNRDGLDAVGCHDVHIIGNHLTDLVDDMIVLGAQTGFAATTGVYTSDAVIANNVCANARWPDPDGQGSGQGIRISGARRVAVTGNTIYRPNTSGITITPQNGMPSLEMAVIGNTIRDAGAPKFEGGLAGTPSDVAWGICLGTSGGSDATPPAGQSYMASMVFANNVIVAPMSHGFRMYGTADVNSEVRDLLIANNMFLGSQASHVSDGAHAIYFVNQYVRHISMKGNVIKDWNGRAISGPVAAQFIDIENNKIVSCCRQNNGYAAMDLSGAANVSWRGNYVVDGISPKNHAYAVNWSSVGTGRMFNNDFTGGGRVGTVAGGAPAGSVQSNNIDITGAVKQGVVPAAGTYNLT